MSIAYTIPNVEHYSVNSHAILILLLNMLKGKIYIYKPLISPIPIQKNITL